MKPIYRKRGVTARYENGSVICVQESGIAVEDGDVFSCEPAFEVADMLHVDDVTAAAAAVRRAAGSVDIERLVLVAGSAEHEYGERSWHDESRQLHISLTHRGERAVVDQASFDPSVIAIVASALERCGDEETDAPQPLRLLPHVSAMLLASALVHPVEGIELHQTSGGQDAFGEPVIEWPLSKQPWPNWWRPGYRTRPVRVPFRVRALAHGQLLDDVPRAVAVLGARGSVGELRLLVDDGERVRIARVGPRRVTAVGAPQQLVPLAAGFFGAEMVL